MIKFLWKHIIFDRPGNFCKECFSEVPHEPNVQSGFNRPSKKRHAVKAVDKYINGKTDYLRTGRARGYTVLYAVNLSTSCVTRVVALCGKDDQFSRKEGRKVCINKLSHGKGVTLLVPKEENWNKHDLDLLFEGFYPIKVK